MRVAVDKAFEVHTLQQFLHTRAFGRTAAAQAVTHVVSHAQVWEQGKVLKHQANLAPLWRHAEYGVTDQLAVYVDRAAVLHLNARDHPQGRGLAAARWPQEAGHLPWHDLQADIIDHRAPVKAAAQVANF